MSVDGASRRIELELKVRACRPELLAGLDAVDRRIDALRHLRAQIERIAARVRAGATQSALSTDFNSSRTRIFSDVEAFRAMLGEAMALADDAQDAAGQLLDAASALKSSAGQCNMSIGLLSSLAEETAEEAAGGGRWAERAPGRGADDAATAFHYNRAPEDMPAEDYDLVTADDLGRAGGHFFDRPQRDTQSPTPLSAVRDAPPSEVEDRQRRSSSRSPSPFLNGRFRPSSPRPSVSPVPHRAVNSAATPHTPYDERHEFELHSAARRASARVTASAERRSPSQPGSQLLQSVPPLPFSPELDPTFDWNRHYSYSNGTQPDVDDDGVPRPPRSPTLTQIARDARPATIDVDESETDVDDQRPASKKGVPRRGQPVPVRWRLRPF